MEESKFAGHLGSASTSLSSRMGGRSFYVLGTKYQAYEVPCLEEEQGKLVRSSGNKLDFNRRPAGAKLHLVKEQGLELNSEDLGLGSLVQPQTWLPLLGKCAYLAVF